MTPMALIALDIDPYLHVGDAVLRWQALALVAVIGLALFVWVRSLRAAIGPEVAFEDAAFVLLAAIPGAVVGGRLLHGLDFLDAYAAQPAALVDLSRGSLSLVGAVVGGALTSAYVCRLLGGKVGVWADASAVALLLVIGLGKVVMLLGGAAQGPGAATDSAVLEGVWALVGVPVVWWLGRRIRGGPRGGHGLVLLAAVGWWLLGRALAALGWHDAPVLGALGMEGLLAFLSLLCVGAMAVLVLARAAPVDERNPSAP
jgi:prolipoprotein diacylglyceryltransferase